jgi:hypothetical protein
MCPNGPSHRWQQATSLICIKALELRRYRFFVSFLIIRSFSLESALNIFIQQDRLLLLEVGPSLHSHDFSPFMLAELPSNQRKVCHPKFLFSYLICFDLVIRRVDPHVSPCKLAMICVSTL